MRKIPDGFGGRLREQRESAGLTQTQLADAGGIKRMAQAQYEKEIRSPNVKYLVAIGEAGLDLDYVLFGSRAEPTSDVQRAVEKRVFEFVEQYARRQAEGLLGAEARFAMFELLRGTLLRRTRGQSAVPLQSDDFLSALTRMDV